MGTTTKTLAAMVAGYAFFAGSAWAQSLNSLDQALRRSVCERVQAPMAFATRDTTFALSLPTDEAATISLCVTVGKNGKVKEKFTRVDANHIARYVAPAFIAATKDLRIDRSLLGTLSGKDTSLTLAFPLEYQCVYDTISKEMPDMTPIPWRISDLLAPRAYWHGKNNEGAIQEMIRKGTIQTPYDAQREYRYYTEPNRVWYYLAFLIDQPE